LNKSSFKDKSSYGYAMAIFAALLWSGNFIIAKDSAKSISPASLCFLRWTIAAILITPFVLKKIIKERSEIKKHIIHLTLTAIFGITLFNTSIAGILMLLTNGQLQDLISFEFHKADWWIMASALAFAIYNIFVKTKPSALHPQVFLTIVFWIGILFLFPFFIREQLIKPTEINLKNTASVLYLGIGASLIAYLCWNAAIRKIGAGKTALFGNLIPVFSMIEAILILGEQLTTNQVISSILIIAGLVVANSRMPKNEQR